MKQTIEIEVPDGMKAIWKDGTIKYVPDEPYWKKITTFQDAFHYVYNYLPDCGDLIESYNNTIPGSFEYNVVCYRIVVAALTNNEKRSLTAGEKWYPVVQFCRPKDKSNCCGNVLIGTIESEGERYSVVGDSARYGSCTGLGSFALSYSNSLTDISFRSVPSKEIAEHISTYFGRLLFEVYYGGTNCDWKWVG